MNLRREPVTVRKVAPRCYQCGGLNELIRAICRSCIRVGVRLALVGAKP